MVNGMDNLSNTPESVELQRKEHALQLFAPEIKQAYGEDPLDLSTKERLGDVLAKGIDSGLSRKTQYKDPYLPNESVEGPVYMLNRGGFMYKMNYIREQQPNVSMNFLSFDIGSLKKMDEAGAANHNLNKVARLAATIVQSYEGATIARYGGDEFVVHIPTGGRSSAEVNHILQTIGAQISTELEKKEHHWGYFDPDDQTFHKPESIKITNTLLSRPENPADRTVFDYFLAEGILLTGDDITKIKQAQRKLGNQGQLASLREIYESHDEYKVLVNDAVGKDRSEQTTNRAKFLEGFINQVIYDRTLRSPVTSFEDFFTEVDKGGVSEVLLLECKFVKELNKYSYLEGDSLVRRVLEVIRTELPRDFHKYFLISRRGGAFMLGLKSGLSPEQLSQAQAGFEKLKQMDRIESTFYGADGLEARPFIVGTHAQTNTEFNMSNLRKGAEKDWHKKYLGSTFAHVSASLEAIIMLMKNERYTHESQRTIDGNYFLEKKRAYGRAKEVLAYVSELNRTQKGERAYLINLASQILTQTFTS
ncbi:MAG: hypothetical protein ACEQSA_00050 [Weeksellaceae bacterium]